MNKSDAQRLWNKLAIGVYGSRYVPEVLITQGSDNYVRIKDTKANETFTVKTISQFESRRSKDNPDVLD